MTPLTKEWVAKAEADYSAAILLMKQRKAPLYDCCRFHSQQCAEKYLKAILQERVIAFPKTHDLVALARLIAPSDPEWLLQLPALESLTNAAVQVRYPGANSTAKDARDALMAAQQIRELARVSLGLRVERPAPKSRRRQSQSRQKKG